jgi:predicted HicB family RNase H-like nuclease
MARSETVRVWLTADLKAAITKLAARDKRSLSQWIELALQRVVDEEERQGKPKRKG